MPGSGKKGYLLIGVYDDGKISGMKVDDALMKRISGIRSDGNNLPLPVMTTEKVQTDKGDVLVVEVTPSFDTPVRFRGRTFIRIGPRRDIASAEEERILAECCAASLPTFDTRPCREVTIDDIDTDTIIKEYLPKAIDVETLDLLSYKNINMRRKGENVFRKCFYRALNKHRESFILELPKKNINMRRKGQFRKCCYIGRRKDGCWEVRTGNQ